MNEIPGSSDFEENLSQVAPNLAKVLKTMRAEKNYTQHDLADKSGLSLRFISDLERGQRQPTLITLFKLANAFEMEISELLARLLKEMKE